MSTLDAKIYSKIIFYIKLYFREIKHRLKIILHTRCEVWKDLFHYNSLVINNTLVKTFVSFINCNMTKNGGHINTIARYKFCILKTYEPHKQELLIGKFCFRNI